MSHTSHVTAQQCLRPWRVLSQRDHKLPLPIHTHHTTTSTTMTTTATTTTASPTPTPGQTKRDGKAVMDEKGPKRHLTCRLGTRWVFFFHYSCLFSLLNYIYRYYVCYRDTEHLLGGYDEGNRPKRRVSRRLGTRWISFLLIGGFFFY